MADNRQAVEEPANCAHCAPPSGGKKVEQPNKKALINRMRRIEGQMGGVRNMIEEDRYCVDILTQVSAIKAALDGVAIQILSSHAKGCVRAAVLEDGGDDVIEEMLEIVRKLIR
ncbi:metal-sensitive transcriptional regulator [Komagataeibacter sp. FNDCF1]|uniref:metal-sensitive transcriptional regulator n=1 Tax=Komagataeibacter sp. FNDCF1 TaxID=2878681 RepID=UPI001E4E79E3|nr:metal-sensitive transcriptional regulator [Komagataeibacter sp. FNDCF1]MCE2564510.1 metal-sensitive transcriptional regulator [Komagataeibacter sp. FNDCF1]